MDKTYKLSNFVLKILACVFMTIDHIGLALELFFGSNSAASICAYVFRIIGRLAYPIFFFLALEGARKTSNIWKYLARLAISWIIVAAAIMIIEFFMMPIGYSLEMFNIFTTLICVVVIYYTLIRTNKWYYKIIAIVPAVILLLTCLYEFDVFYFSNDTVATVMSAFMPDYATFTLLLLVFFFIPYAILSYRINKTYKTIENEKDLYTEEEYNAYLAKKDYFEVGNQKTSMSISVVLSCVVCYLLTYIEGFSEGTVYALSTYAVLSVIFILLYNGKLGYSNKVVKYGFYLYYPIHILVIFGIFYLVYVLI